MGDANANDVEGSGLCVSDHKERKQGSEEVPKAFDRIHQALSGSASEASRREIIRVAEHAEGTTAGQEDAAKGQKSATGWLSTVQDHTRRSLPQPEDIFIGGTVLAHDFAHISVLYCSAQHRCLDVCGGKHYRAQF